MEGEWVLIEGHWGTWKGFSAVCVQCSAVQCQCSAVSVRCRHLSLLPFHFSSLRLHCCGMKHGHAFKIVRYLPLTIGPFQLYTHFNCAKKKSFAVCCAACLCALLLLCVCLFCAFEARNCCTHSNEGGNGKEGLLSEVAVSPQTKLGSTGATNGPY